MKCYLCHKQAIKFIEKNGYTIFKCPHCGLGMTEFLQNYQTFVKEHYTKGYFTGNPQYSAYTNYKKDKRIIVKNMSKFLKKIRHIHPTGKLLDVGCALGYFVELALNKGYDAYGFDPSDYAVDEAIKLNGKERIKQGTIGTISYQPQSFDVITLFDVFEHLADPKKDLQKLMSYLKKDGIIVIATGDTKSLAARVLKRKWTFYIPPQHLFFFNQYTLTTLLQHVGLVPFKWFRIGKWLSLEYIFHLARTTGESNTAHHIYPIVKKLPIGRIPLFIPMQDNMAVIAKKIL